MYECTLKQGGFFIVSIDLMTYHCHKNNLTARLSTQTSTSLSFLVQNVHSFEIHHSLEIYRPNEYLWSTLRFRRLSHN